MNREERKARAAERKRQLADKIDSNELLLASLAFYLHRLKPGKPALTRLIHEGYKDTSRKQKLTLRACRRVLGIQYKEGGRLIRLPENFYIRLRKIGLDLADWDLRERIEALNPNLIVDEPMKEFASTYRILEAAKDWLRASAGPKPEPPPFQLDQYASYLQTRFQTSLSAWRDDRAL